MVCTIFFLAASGKNAACARARWRYYLCALSSLCNNAMELGEEFIGLTVEPARELMTLEGKL